MNVELWILSTLFLLFLKHWYIDFVNQTMEEVNHKGIYGSWLGMKHSVKHGAGTFLIFLVMGPSMTFAFALGVLDFVLHYNIDWAKMNWGNRDIQNPKFWAHLGLDQFAHSVTYLLFVGILVV